jgi:hypothetical protein
MIQATYHKTGLTPEDSEKAYRCGKFVVVPRQDEQVHVMLYPKDFPDAKVQISRNSANVWCRDFKQLWKIEELLNETFRDKPKRKPFKQPEIQLLGGECRKILETPLGLLSILIYYYRYEIAESVYYTLQSMNKME